MNFAEIQRLAEAGLKKRNSLQILLSVNVSQAELLLHDGMSSVQMAVHFAPRLPLAPFWELAIATIESEIKAIEQGILSLTCIAQ